VDTAIAFSARVAYGGGPSGYLDSACFGHFHSPMPELRLETRTMMKDFPGKQSRQPASEEHLFSCQALMAWRGCAHRQA
jgi:hypothetical protein